jgi:hypothetical protein
VTQFPTYHDLVAANIPPDVVAVIEESYGLPILEAVEKYRYLVAANIPDVVATIEEQCGMPFEEAVEKYGGRPILCDDGSYVSIADPPGCGPEHFAAKAEAYRLLFERQDRARTVTDARAALRLDATPATPRRQRKPRKPTLAGVAKQASKAGIEVARYEVKPDGTVVIVTGTPAPTEPDNPWPLDEFRTKETKQ